MKKITSFFLGLLILSFGYSQNPDVIEVDGSDGNGKGMKVGNSNFTTFSNQIINVTTELQSNTPVLLQSHPEFGILPSNAPCTDCYELLEKREPTIRYFVKYNSDGRDFLLQTAYDPFNYIDNNGWMRSLNKKLSPSSSEANVYVNKGQPDLTKIDLNNFTSSLTGDGDELVFNKNLKLYLNVNGVNQLLASADWSNATVGDEGAYVTNIFPDIDLEIRALHGAFKSNFIIKNNLNLVGDYLMIEDDFVLPSNTMFDMSNAILTQNGLYQGRLDIDDIYNSNLYYMESPTIYDNANSNNGVEYLSYKVANNKLELYASLSFINDPARAYPIIVDPLVSTNNTLLQASITGSGLNNAGAWVNACPYNLTVASPAQATLTDIFFTFDYRAQNGAWLNDGGMDLLYNGCRSPAGAGFFWYCNWPGPGTCNSAPGLSNWGDWSGCVPAPQCASYNMDFTLNFYERFNPGFCRNTYISRNSNWVMTVEGRTVEEPVVPTSSNGLTICDGSSTTLTANGSFGVPPYTYSWAPGGGTTQSTVVSPPVGATNYVATITDVCGNTAVNNVTITTQAQTLFPTPNLSYTMSPASGTPCPVTVTYFTNIGTSYNGGPETYLWGFAGGTVTSGGGTSGSTNGPTYGGSGGQYTVVYNTPGNYSGTINIVDNGGSDCAANTVTFAICGALPITLTSFTAEAVDNTSVSLEWITESEINNDFFTIEKSNDAIDFEVVGIVDGAGNSSVENGYRLLDDLPFKGTSYYRLKQTDYDGSYEYSDIITVKLVSGFDDLIIYPNPVEGLGYLSFITSSEALTKVIIYDISGRKVSEKSYLANKGSNKFTLETKELTEGMYFLTLNSGSEIMTIKFTKN